MSIPKQATWVRFPRFVGDATVQLAILRLLRSLDLGPLVVWGPAATVALVQDHELADAVLADSGKPSAWAMAATLRRYRAARSIHFPKSLRPALAAFLARVPERIGVDESLAGFFNTHSGPFWKASGPFVLRYHAVLASRWPELPAMPFADYVPTVSVALPEAPYLCLMPGSVWASKTWPPEHFRAVARMARQQGLEVVVLGTPDEREICDFVAQDATLNLCGSTTLVQAAAWLRGARAVLGNDSGLSQLAAACGTPTLALYGSSDPAGSGPWGPHTRTLRLDGVACAPCFKPHCFVPGHPCLAGLSPELAWGALLELLSS